jgi:trimethylamine:corrinoid methyltransferase-like protein
MRNGIEWKLAVIKEVRKAKNDDEEDFKFDTTEESKLKHFGGDENMKFEYYISYVGLQRRNDRWVEEDEVRIDADEIERERELLEKKEQEEKDLNE